MAAQISFFCQKNNDIMSQNKTQNGTSTESSSSVRAHGKWKQPEVDSDRQLALDDQGSL